jgi:hypothetical protein
MNTLCQNAAQKGASTQNDSIVLVIIPLVKTTPVGNCVLVSTRFNWLENDVDERHSA